MTGCESELLSLDSPGQAHLDNVATVLTFTSCHVIDILL